MQAGRWRSGGDPAWSCWRLAAAACGGDDDSAGEPSSAPPAATAGAATTAVLAATPPPRPTPSPLKVGYSAWPGWFPLAVAEKQGIFEQAGVDVELTYFADYISSLDALVAGSIDVNTQTLNDTIFGVAAGSEQRIFVTNDNSTGNDAIICDAAITTVEDLKGKSIAAEPGVVDHFLLLQGLAGGRHDRGRHRVLGPHDRRRGRRLRRRPVRLRRRVRPVHHAGAGREAGSHVLFSSKDFPGTISDHFVATAKVADEHPEALQKLVDAWYLTLRVDRRQPRRGDGDHGRARPASRRRSTRTYAEGTTIFDAQQALDSFERPGRRPDVAARDGPAHQPVPRRGRADRSRRPTSPACSCPQFTQAYVDGNGG